MKGLYIAAVVLRLHFWQGDSGETKEHRAERIIPTVTALKKVVRTNEELAAMLTIAEHESHFASYVLEGRCLDGPKGAQCDPDENGIPRASGPWQVWVRYCKPAQGLVDGTPERIEATARCAISRLRQGLLACPKEGWQGAISFYKASRCNWEGAIPRAQRMREILVIMKGTS